MVHGKQEATEDLRYALEVLLSPLTVEGAQHDKLSTSDDEFKQLKLDAMNLGFGYLLQLTVADS